MSTSPRAIIWDLDGTLVDSAPDLAGALNALLAESGLPAHPLERVKTMIGGGVRRLVMRGYDQAGAPLDEAEVLARTDQFMAMYGARATQETVLFDGVVEALTALTAQGFVHGICTNKPLGLTRQILDALHIADHFGSVVGGDSTPHTKPHPEPMLTCLKGLNATPEQAIMVGDSSADLGVSQAVKMPCVLVSFGYSPEPVGTLGAEATIDRFDQLPDALARLGR